LPSEPGVYRFLSGDDAVLYVGKAKDLKSRVSSYFTNGSVLGEKTRMLVSQIKTIDITVVESELESLLLEAFYIKKFKPKYNIRLTDDKAYPLIRITMKDQYPAVFVERRAEDPDSVYYGPFPSAGSVRSVLKTLRRIYPFLTTRNHPKRICLYNHLGLCVCPPVHDTEELRKEYKKYIRNTIRILEGESHKLQNELEKERDAFSKAEDFENAADLQKRINALSIITQPFIRPVEYDVNPNLREDIRDEELENLREVLSKNGLSVTYLNRIEGYDISNIQGTHATGSLVVLTSGEIDKSQYRKFKIHKSGKPNDFAMMEEMLGRRLKHAEWPDPDLIVVDGGKGQITSVMKALNDADKKIPLIGLAKREETIVIPTEQEFFNREKVRHSGDGQRKDSGISPGTLSERDSGQARMTMKLYGVNEDNFIEVSLPKDAPGLKLIMRLRNEAHRFAITYHRKLRSKAMTS
jgi:excinuclease ABC subunit C